MNNIDLDKGRNTGRTERMLFAAAQHALYNGQTIVLMHNTVAISTAYQYLRGVFKQTVIDQLVFRHPSSGDCEWLDMGTPIIRGLRGAIFVDHHVYAERLHGINKLLEGFHKYDTDSTK